MTEFATMLAPDVGQDARPIKLLRATELNGWLAGQTEAVRALAAAHRFEGKPGTFVIVPGNDGWGVVAGVGEDRDQWSLAYLADRLPDGIYRLIESAVGVMSHGWLLAQHRYDRYRRKDGASPPRILLTHEPGEIEAAVRLADAVALVRDLVDTPALDCGPADLQLTIERLASMYGATVAVTLGGALAEHYPLIHAVGQAAAADRAPRLIELEWGDPGDPRVTLVGKGVCFDTGGLDIKSSTGMLLMKKDMGGAAHALALAQLVMAARLPVRLHLCIPAVENAISGSAVRPGDVLRSRKGLSVEIVNTDAEGRLILADAVARAGEATPELLIDFATLTSAARVALGPDLPALFSNSEPLAAEFASAAAEAGDPVWRLPLWQPYTDALESDIADIRNAALDGFSGAITAALFIERFVPAGLPWVHLDTYAWRPSAEPGRPKGGDALGLRAAWQLLHSRYGRNDIG